MIDRRLVLATVLLLAVLACGGTATPVETPPATAPATVSVPLAPTVAPEAPMPTAAPGSVTLILYNYSDQTICYVYIATPTGGDEWLDRLGPTEVIRPGEHRVFFIPPGRYDMCAQDCTHRYIGVWYNADLSGKMNWFVSGDEP